MGITTGLIDGFTEELLFEEELVLRQCMMCLLCCTES